MVRIKKYIALGISVCMMLGMSACKWTENNPTYAYNHSGEISDEIIQTIVDAKSSNSPELVCALFSQEIQENNTDLYLQAEELLAYIEGDDITFKSNGGHVNSRGHESRGYSCEIDGNYRMVTSEKTYTIVFKTYPTVVEGHEKMKGVQSICVDESEPEGRDCLVSTENQGIAVITDENIEEYTKIRQEWNEEHIVPEDAYDNVIQGIVDAINARNKEKLLSLFSEEQQDENTNLSNEAAAFIEYIQGDNASFEEDTRDVRIDWRTYGNDGEIVGAYKITTSVKEYYLVFDSKVLTDKEHKYQRGLRTICIDEYNPTDRESVAAIREDGIIIISDDNYDKYLSFEDELTEWMN